jgi:hypothetical protein
VWLAYPTEDVEADRRLFHVGVAGVQDWFSVGLV